MDPTLATENFTRNGFSMYPNPASSEFFITQTGSTSITNLKLYDLTGKMLIEQQLANAPTTSVNTASLQSGMYLVVLEDNTGKRFSSKLSVY
jgi:hypothetical protein